MDADIFVSGKKKSRIQKYPDTCGRGLKKLWHYVDKRVKQKFGFIKQVDKGWITIEKDYESFSLKFLDQSGW